MGTEPDARFPPCPDGREDCRFYIGGRSSTLIGWTQVFDREGRPLNQDPNTHKTAMSCSSCGRCWQRCERGDERWWESGSPESLLRHMRPAPKEESS